MAAYFAEALRTGDSRWADLPGNPSLKQLSYRADELAREREDKDVYGLADAIDSADRMMR